MAYPEFFRKIVKKLLASQGLTLTSLNPGRTTMANACRAIAARGHALSTVIDIGASDGRWSLDFMRYYPDSQYLLIEAQLVHEPKLKSFCSIHSKSQYVLSAAGEISGEIFFDGADPLGGQASYKPYAEHNLVVPVTTVDIQVETRQLPGPYLIKFDTHGFEVPILRGAARTLESTEIIIMECYNYRIAPESLLFNEMVSHLDGLGFKSIDLADPMFRPYDDTLWQMDLVFVRKDWPGLTYNEYS